MTNIWITSDPHFSHINIIKGTSQWSDKSSCRNFNTIADHNNAIVDGINNYVQQEDILYCLGDWSFGGIANIWNFRKRIVCKNIHLLLGNHDHHIRNNKVLPNVFSSSICEFGFPLEFNEDPTSPICVKARQLFSSVKDVIEIKIEGHYIFMSHYSHRVWNGSHKGIIHLYAHSHGTIPDFGKSMDVGVDVAYRLLGEYRPFKFQEIQKIMSRRDIEFVDHHNKNTN